MLVRNLLRAAAIGVSILASPLASQASSIDDCTCQIQTLRRVPVTRYVAYDSYETVTRYRNDVDREWVEDCTCGGGHWENVTRRVAYTVRQPVTRYRAEVRYEYVRD